jgi:Zn-dependent protease with chaperone function
MLFAMNFPKWRRSIAHRRLTDVIVLAAAVSLLFHGHSVGYSNGTKALAIWSLWLALFLLRANSIQIEQVRLHEATPAQFPYPMALRHTFAYLFPVLFFVFYFAFAQFGLPPWLFAAAMAAFLIIRAYLYPTILAPSLVRHPEKEAQLRTIAGDLMQHADELRCPVAVADQFLQFGDEKNEEPNLNAFAHGIGNGRCIVIDAEVMDHFPSDAIRGLLAHEIAHVHHRHLTKALAWMIAPWSILVAISQTGAFSPQVTASSFILLLIPLRWLSRRHELQADWQAAEWVGVDAMELTIDNLAPDTFDSAYDGLMRTHPTHAYRKKVLLAGQPIQERGNDGR